MRKIIQYILKVLARAMLARYKPKIVGVTGSVGKTGAKDAIHCVLAVKFKVRKSEKSYNNEIGLPLTVLGISSSGKNIFGWLFGFFKVLSWLIYINYPEILVLEMGVDKPKDMDYLLKIVKPDIAVFTSVGEIPVHVENFTHREALLKEKAKLALAVPKHGFVVYDKDSPDWPLFLEKAKAGAMTYGFVDGADIKIHPLERRFAVIRRLLSSPGSGVAGDEEFTKPLGVAFKIEYKGNTVPFRIDNIFSDAGAYATGAACAVGVILEMNLIEISSAFSHYAPPRGRMNLLEGIKSSLILDDTYNSSPSSSRSALDALRILPAKRKIAVLGDMLELGGYSEEAHREAGRQAAKICDVVFAVGTRMGFARHELSAHGFKEGENLFYFESSEPVGFELKNIIKEGDLILVKGSQGMRMEKAVKEIMAHPENAKELLVRQEKEWLKINGLVV